MRRQQKNTRKLLKFKIDAQKSEDCRSWKLEIKNGSNPVFEPNILYERDGFTVTAIFTSVYAVLKGFTLISTKA